VWDSYGRLAVRCFASEDCRLRYVKALQEAARRFEGLQLERKLLEIEKTIAGAVARDHRRPHRDKERARALEVLRAFLRERPAEIRAATTCWDGARELDRDGDGAGCQDCDDADAKTHPGAAELCDGKDNDCSGVADDASMCPCPIEVVGERSFELCDMPVSWWRAKDFCAARGAVLARVDGEDVARPLRAATKKVKESDFWIGLHDQDEEGDFRFLDGGKPRSSLWGKGEPDDYACGQHCAALRKGSKAKLRDLHCATPNPFICEQRAP
jgi:hypothetical protein